MNTIYWHMNATQGGANLHPGVNLLPGANLHPRAKCAHEHAFKGFPFQLSKNARHTPSFINIISGHKPCRTILNLFQFFLRLIRMGVPDRACILQDWTHHTFISCFLHILGAGEKSSPQEFKCFCGFSANINKGAYEMCGQRASDLRLCFRIFKNQVMMTQFICEHVT